ncbi:MAG: hypothetical protein V3S56_09910 [Gemmatimonadota bacterium]
MRSANLVVGMLFTAILPFAAGCAGEGTASTGLEAAIDTIGGIERLHYPETGATTLPWRFDTVAVIGGFTEEDPDKQFGQVFHNGLASDAAGNLYVFDNQGKRIIGFSTAGEVIGTWGREGEGPGEIGAWGGVLAMGPGDTLWLADSSNQRITLFPTDGGDPASIPAPEGSSGFGGKIVVVPDGILSMMSSFTFSPGSDARMPDRPLVHVGRDGTVRDTLWSVPAAETDVVTITTGNNRMMMMMSRVFSPNFSYDRFSDGGLVKQDQAAYEFHLVASDGTVERIIQRDPAPRATTDEDRQRVLDKVLEPRDGEVTDMQKKQAEAMTFSDVIPPINILILDKADRIWVGVSETVPGENERLDIYSRDGQLLGELHDVDLPQLFFGDGYAALITEDELDVQQIVILRLIETT